MVKVRRKMDFSLYPQRFFNVFLPDQSSHRMKFPSAFVKHLNRTIPFKATIVTPNKSSWVVQVEKIGDNLYFNMGWEQFVYQNSLKFGDFIVFSYDGNSIFRVKIYGRNGCEKESTYHTHEKSQILSLIEENQVFQHRDRNLEEASEFKSDYPFFKLVMQPTYVAYGPVTIPQSFIKRHMSDTTTSHKKGITLIYSDKSWRMNITRWRTMCKISGGWIRFLKDNALKAGDICIFELVDGNNYVFNVSIIRCLD